MYSTFPYFTVNKKNSVLHFRDGISVRYVYIVTVIVFVFDYYDFRVFNQSLQPRSTTRLTSALSDF